MSGPRSESRSASELVAGTSKGPSGRDRLALPGVAIAAIAFLLGGVPGGLLAAGLLVGGWLVAPPVAVATLGAFLLVGGPSSALSAALALVGVALIVLLPTLRAPAPGLAILATVGVALPAIAAVQWLLGAYSLAIAAGALLLGGTMVGYALHRYALVAIERPERMEVGHRG